MRHASVCRHELSDLTSDLDATQTSFLRPTGLFPWSGMHESLLQQPRNREVLKLEHQHPHGGRGQEWARIGVGVWDSPQTQVAVWEVYLAIPTVYKAASKQQPAEILRAITIPQMDTLRLVPGAGRWKGMPRLPAVRSGLNYSLFPSFGNPSLGIWTGFLVCDSIYHPTGFKRRRCHGGESE